MATDTNRLHALGLYAPGDPPGHTEQACRLCGCTEYNPCVDLADPRALLLGGTGPLQCVCSMTSGERWRLLRLFKTATHRESYIRTVDEATRRHAVAEAEHIIRIASRFPGNGTQEDLT